MIDRWDAIGAAGSALIAAGVYQLVGWPWAAILIGSELLGLYLVREIRAAQPRRNR